MNQYKSKKLGINNYKVDDEVIIINYNEDCLIPFNCINMIGRITFYKPGYYTLIEIEGKIGYFSDSDFKFKEVKEEP